MCETSLTYWFVSESPTIKFVLAVLLPLGSFLGAATVSLAQNTPYPEALTHTSKSFRRVLHDLLKAIGTNEMSLLAHICTYCGAKAIGLKTPGQPHLDSLSSALCGAHVEGQFRSGRRSANPALCHQKCRWFGDDDLPKINRLVRAL